jgi:hypothetical protein
MRTTSILVVALAAALTLAATAVAKDRVLGQTSASGDFAMALANGTATNPHVILVRVVSAPRQAVSGHWMLVCGRGMGGGSRTGSFKGVAPLTRPLRLPMVRAELCTVAASAKLSHSGRITVSLIAR